MTKEALFKIITISLPIVLLLLLEGALRITGYGQNYALFNQVSIEGRPDYLEMNPAIAKKYFKDKGFHSDNQFDLFLKTKTDSTYRVFVQGASTTVGFPYYHGGAFPRMLKHRLSQTFPEKNIEVVNTGITAVNSYTLWDLTDQIIDQKPDLIIIYAGHNEYYGALGTGSSRSLGRQPTLVRTYLYLKDFRFFQLLENTMSSLINHEANPSKIGETTLMEVMAKEQRIPLQSESYQTGIDQFESNMDRILAKYKKNNIPVILSTLVSNEKDIKPFISDSLENEEALIHDLKNSSLSAATKKAQNNALAAYLLGQYYLEYHIDSAQKYLHLAKELDLLRFRAPDDINRTIRRLGQKHDYPLVDMEKVFLTHSPKKVIGDELMMEHVHPNIQGYFLMADAFYEKMKKLNHVSNNWPTYISYDEAILDLPITAIDSIKGKYVTDNLKKSWPYNLKMEGSRALMPYSLENASYEEKMVLNLINNRSTWKEVMTQSYEIYKRKGDYKQALKVAQSLILEYPETAKLYRSAGEMCIKLNQPDKANYYFQKYAFLSDHQGLSISF